MLNKQTFKASTYQLTASTLLPPSVLGVLGEKRGGRLACFLRICAVWGIVGLRGIHTSTGFFPMRPNQVTFFYLGLISVTS